MREVPNIDPRTAREVYQYTAQTLKQRLGIDTAQDEMAEALLRIFARYSELIIQRLNQVPDKNHISFLAALGISRIPPVPAQVPLTFKPVNKPPGGRRIVVPAHTQVAAPSDGESEPIVFETTRDLALTNISVEKIIAVDPQLDRYSDKSLLATPEGGPGEFAFAARTPMPHEFYISHETMFKAAGISRLALHFEVQGGNNAVSEQPSIDWWIPAPEGEHPVRPVKDTTSGLRKSGEILFEDLPEWPVHALFGCHRRWLGCRLRGSPGHPAKGAERELSTAFPRVVDISLSARWHMEDSPLSQAFFNALAIDLSRDFYPLGERPRFNDTFYLSSDAFARPQVDITLEIELTNPASAGGGSPLPAASKAGDAVIQWECCDGQRWIAVDCQDTTEALTEDGHVSFVLPSAARVSVVNGQEGVWVRARLIRGDYGEDERIEYAAEKVRQRPSTLGPPSVKSITVTASLAAGPVRPERILTHNSLILDEVGEAQAFQPFRAAAEPNKALYLGYRVPDENVHALANGGIDLYFHLRESATGPAHLRDASTHESPQLSWQYWNGKCWKDAGVDDMTEALLVPGIITLRVAEDVAPWQRSSLGPELHWLRALWTAGTYDCQPELRRLLLNTVSATQAITLEKELLGSSNAKPNQTFRAARTPILRDVQLEVREPDMPEAEELEAIYREEGRDAVTKDHDVRGIVEQIWVRWYEVSDFLSSTHRDRHFLVDRETGQILFGDDRNGMIPPAGTNNIRLRRYQTGGGAAGNLPAGSVTQLRTAVPYVDSVTNLSDACDGQDSEDLAVLRDRGSHRLRHRERAVTVEDYEDLATLASPSVAKAKCYPCQDRAANPAGGPLRPGVVSIVIVPHGREAKPRPNLNLLCRVRDYLTHRRMPGTKFVVMAPEYVRVTVMAVVVPEQSDTVVGLASRCEGELNHYLHPVSGGNEGRGWAFGQLCHESDLYALLESVPGLDYVRTLEIRTEEEHAGLLKRGDFLICSGTHRIRQGA